MRTRLAAFAVLAALSVAAVVAAAAAARTPLPARAQGTGTQPTSGGGSVAGAPFRVRSAYAFQDGYGDINVFLMSKKSSCHAATEEDVPYVWVYLYTAGHPLPVGKAVSAGSVLVNFTTKTGRFAVRKGVSLLLSRVDASSKGVWHGTLKVAKQRVSGSSVAYQGSFAARWCGQR